MKDAGIEGGWIDVTLPVEAGMTHWPGDPEVVLERVVDMRNGDICNVTRMNMCVHTGTHMDAPVHFLADGAGMETVPVDVLVGRSRMIRISDPVSIRKAELEAHDIQPGERILLQTQNITIPRGAPFKMDFVYIAADAAQYLADRKVGLVGVDYMSVGGFYNDMVETHKLLLSAGVWIVENVDMRDLEPGNYEILCMPMKIVGADGAPARVLLRPVQR